MKLRILDSASEDLDRGRQFYERQGEGLGAYFLDSLFAEIESLMLYAGIHRKVFGFHPSSPDDFHMAYTTELRTAEWPLFGGCWT